MRVRDEFFEMFGGMDFDAPPLLPPALLAGVRPPSARAGARGRLGAALRAPGGRGCELLGHAARPVTFVMHSFMDAAVVTPAWERMPRGERLAESRVARGPGAPAACLYPMAHPESDTLVPACAQHSVLDPEENRALARLLPLERVAS